jgi:TRAP-type C4-dicarboxylate transport system substrate-binding protein
MNRIRVAEELVEIARLLAGERTITAEEMEEICPACAEKMRQNEMASISESVVASAIREAAKKQADRWEDMPKGWTDESREKFWNSLTGDVQHRITKCIKEMQGKVSDPGAFCGALASRVSYR